MKFFIFYIYLLSFFFLVSSISGSHHSCEKLTGCSDCLSSSSQCLWVQCAKVYDRKPGFFWFTHSYSQDIEGSCVDPLLSNVSLPNCTSHSATSSYSVERFNFTQPAQCKHRPYDGSYFSFFTFSLLLLVLLVILFALVYYFTYRNHLSFVQSRLSYGLSSTPCESIPASSIPRSAPSGWHTESACLTCFRPIPRMQTSCPQCYWEYRRLVFSLLVLLPPILALLYIVISFLCLSDSAIAHTAHGEFWIMMLILAASVAFFLVAFVSVYLWYRYRLNQSDTSHQIHADEHRTVYLESNLHLILRPNEEYYLLQRSKQPPPNRFSLASVEPIFLIYIHVIALFFPLLATPYLPINLEWANDQDFFRLFAATIPLLIFNHLLVLGLAIPFFRLFSSGHHCKYLIVTSERVVLVYHILPSNSYTLRSIEHIDFEMILPVCPSPASPSVWMRIRALLFDRQLMTEEHVASTYCTIPIEQLSNDQLLEFRLSHINHRHHRIVVTNAFPELSQSISLIATLRGLVPEQWDGLTPAEGEETQTNYPVLGTIWVIPPFFFYCYVLFTLPEYIIFLLPFVMSLGAAAIMFYPTISLLCVFLFWFLCLGIGYTQYSILFLTYTPFILVCIPFIFSVFFKRFFLQIKQYALPFFQHGAFQTSFQETSDLSSDDLETNDSNDIDERDELSSI